MYENVNLKRVMFRPSVTDCQISKLICLVKYCYYDGHVDGVVQTQEALACAEERNAELTAVHEALVDKETTIDQLKEQVKSLLQEVASLTEAYARLQVSASVTLFQKQFCNVGAVIVEVAFMAQWLRDVLTANLYHSWPHAGSRVVTIDPLHFLARCH